MSATNTVSCAWLDAQFYQQLHRLEGRHQQIQSEHEVARRRLERLQPADADELRSAWRSYCEVIAELEHTTAELELLSARVG
jgi:hypothetical protein